MIKYFINFNQIIQELSRNHLTNYNYNKLNITYYL